MPSTEDAVGFFDFAGVFFEAEGLRGVAFFFATGRDLETGADFFLAMVVCPCGPFAQDVGRAMNKPQLWSSQHNSQESNWFWAVNDQGLHLSNRADRFPVSRCRLAPKLPLNKPVGQLGLTVAIGAPQIDDIPNNFEVIS